MKKIFTLIISMIAVTSVFAQYGHNSQNNTGYDRNISSGHDNGYNDQRTYGHGNNSGNTSYDRQRIDNGYGSQSYYDNNYNNRQRQDRMDRNRESGYYEGNNSHSSYDSRYSRNNRNNSGYYERDARMQRDNRGSGKLKAVGAGLIVGGIIALMAGSR